MNPVVSKNNFKNWNPHLCNHSRKKSLNKLKKGFSFNPRLPNVGRLIQKHLSIIQTSEELSKIFSKSIFPTFRRPMNLKELVNSKRTHSRNNTVNNVGCFKCNKKCDFSANFFKESNSFSSIKTGRKYFVKLFHVLPII